MAGRESLLSSGSSGLLGLLLLAGLGLFLAQRSSRLGHRSPLLGHGWRFRERSSGESVASFSLLQHSSSVQSKEYFADDKSTNLGALLGDRLLNGPRRHWALVCLERGDHALRNGLTTSRSLRDFAGGSSLLLFGGLSRLSLGGFLGLSRFSRLPGFLGFLGFLGLFSLLGLLGFLGYLSPFLAIGNGGELLLFDDGG